MKGATLSWWEIVRLGLVQSALGAVVVLTTSEAEKDVARAYYNHANSYLVKPVGFDEFKKLMDDLGFYWLSWNTHPGIKD